MYVMKWQLCGLSVAMMLSACSMGPDFKRPKTAQTLADKQYINAPAARDAHEAPSMAKWWTRIDDKLLSEQVAQLLSDNLNLKQAAERIAQAQARRDIEYGGYFPSIGGEASTSRQRQSGSTLYGGGTVNYYNTYDAGINASWQIDLFGRTRRAVEAADAAYEAASYDAEALKHSLIAELVQRRAAIATQQRLLQLAQENTDNRETVYRLVRQRYESGSRNSAVSDVFLSKNNLSQTKADQHQYRQQLQDEAYQLDVLLGQLPGSTKAETNSFPMMPSPHKLPACLPIDLLDRRPDLRASELRTRAANAEIGVAIADLYPSLSLGGTLGFSSINDTSLFTSSYLGGSLLASITSRIFEGGALRANIRLQEAEARELAAAYAESILNAVREVETALMADQQLTQRIEELKQSVNALKEAEAISEKRYISGILSLQDYLNTQQQRYAAEQNLLVTQQNHWNNRVALYLALGGDWFNDENGARLSTQCSERPTT